MKALVTIGDDRYFLAVDSKDAVMLTQLLAVAQVYERDGWNSPVAYKPCEQPLGFKFVTEDTLSPEDPKVKAAKDEAQKKNVEWYQEHTKRQAAEKEVATLKAQLETLKSVTTCTTKAEESVVSDDEEIF
jgi:hypothetical protein